MARWRQPFMPAIDTGHRETAAMFRLIALAVLVLAAGPAAANDSIAELKTGGLVLVRTDAISMDREDLFISLDEIQVAYRFRNTTDADVDTIVAFPMPEIQYNPYGDTALPDTANDNFLGFSATVEGVPVDIALEQKAYAAGLDVTDLLKRHGVPLFPFGDEAFEALKAQTPATLRDWESRGLVFNDRYDVGDGVKDHPTPAWTLRSTYWWRMTFPAGRSIMVEHRYKPSIGGTAGVSFFQDGRFSGETHADYRERYCLDEAFERAILRETRARGADYPPFYESRIAYVLKTGGNWAGGTIGTFRLTVDKGSTKNFVSFCADTVRKVGPTTFEATQTDFYPERDLEVLFLRPADY
ncbi:DUF4424 domain-containing protein [Polymorphum gilvum]|uniref:Conserved hypothetical exported protein n=1 Tax=Polymorphum gilvum (strain LMG 25793 / CGMCC 1.9160 / SL003B-26A1) TaxID=991905 RepID=F2J4N6_POLGS|nr:DUF4424 domain-containing protein [Polymorphum gilvum]ADZ72288.1 Conserved hypothetical exported protein [Polymorphum gilvum SL003B-26A1]